VTLESLFTSLCFPCLLKKWNELKTGDRSWWPEVSFGLVASCLGWGREGRGKPEIDRQRGLSPPLFALSYTLPSPWTLGLCSASLNPGSPCMQGRVWGLDQVKVMRRPGQEPHWKGLFHFLVEIIDFGKEELGKMSEDLKETLQLRGGFSV
jgi:hypothetical protein